MIRIVTRIAAALLLLVTSAACTSQPAGAPPTSTPPMQTNLPAGDPTATIQPNRPTPLPVNLTVQPEADQASTQVLNADGGEVSAISAAGVRYTLSVPKGALPGETEIRLIPVNTQGLPFSAGQTGALQLEPEGLYFLKPAELKIEAPAVLKPEALVGFAYDGAGENFHMIPLNVAGSTITLAINHFSGYGSAEASPTEIQDQAARTPTQAEAQAGQAAVEILKRTQGNYSEKDLQQLATIFTQWFNSSVKPALQAAAQDDATLESAVREFLSWEYTAVILSGMKELEDLRATGNVLLGKALKHSFEQSYERCLANNDPMEGNKMLTRLSEITVLQSPPEFTVDNYTITGKSDQLIKCLTFKLKFDSTINWEIGGPEWTITHHVVAEVIMKPKVEELFHYNGRGKLDYQDYKINLSGEFGEAYGPCSTEAFKNSAYLNVYESVIDWQKTATGKAPKPKVMLMLAPGTISELVKWKCSGQAGWFSVDIPFDMPLWSAGFDKLHEKDSTTQFTEAPGKVYGFNQFEYAGGEVLARHQQTYQAVVEEVPVKEDLLIEITHAPGQ